MVCWFSQLCLSCASFAVLCGIMAMALSSAKARFCVLVATLVLMMGHVCTRILFALMHPSVSLALLLSLAACVGAGGLFLS